MPEKKTLERAAEDKRAGRSASTQAGEFVREEMDHIREGRHGARSTKQAIAIGLSKARRAGVDLKPPKEGATSPETRRKAERDLKKGKTHAKPSAKRSAARSKALKKEPKSAATPAALSKQAKQAAAARKRRGPATASGKKPATKKAAARKKTSGVGSGNASKRSSR